MPQVMSADEIWRAIRRLSHEILETHTDACDVVLVGIHTRGVSLAHHVAATLGEFADREVPVGELDIGLYRDDRDLRTDIVPKSTHLPVDITNRHVVIVDDVLYTGRTVRAALDALFDHGRAASTELAVLVDRGHRELPIRADYVGKNVPTSADEMVKVLLEAQDGEDGVWIECVEAGARA